MTGGEKVNITIVKVLFQRTVKRVRYKLGAKVDLDADSAAFNEVDCSGYSRWLVHRASSGSVTMPDGSISQREWADSHWRKLDKYSDVQYAAADASRLFIAFRSPKPGNQWPRHVFLIIAGQTIESSGGKMGGVGSRKWPEFRNVAACYEVPVC